MIVAIVDNGICDSEFKTTIEHYYIGNNVNEESIHNNHFSHGTKCAKIIEKYSSPSKIIDIAYLDENGKGNIDDMCTALEMCENISVDVINISNGVEIYNKDSMQYKRLLDICRRLYIKNIRIFAAQSNNGKRTIPAEFPYVISVEHKNTAKNISKYVYRRSDVYTKGNHILNLDNQRCRTHRSNSFACAYAVSQYEKKYRGKRNFSGFFSSDPSLYQVSYNKKNQAILTLDGITSGRIFTDRYCFPDKLFANLRGEKYFSLEVPEIIKKRIKYESSVVNKELPPVVCIAESEYSGDFAIKLTSFFINDGFNTLLISDDKRDFFKGITYSPQDISYNILQILSVKKFDITFWITSKLNFHYGNGLSIEVSKNSIRINDSHKKYNMNDINMIAEEIISYYS